MFNPEKTPAWVSGAIAHDGSYHKYVRAVDFLKKRNAELKAQKQPEVEITEEAVKELYVRFGGLVLDVEPTDESDEEVSSVKPRRGRPRAE